MQIWNGLAEVAALGDAEHGSVVCIGNFDGVHLGHRALLAATAARGKALGLASVAITFEPHTTALLADPPPLLTTGADRLRLIAECGIDAALVVPFTREFAALTPEEFARDVLAGALGARVVVAGQDLRFGAGGAGGLDALRQFGERFGFTAETLADVVPLAASARNSVGLLSDVDAAEAGRFALASACIARPTSAHLPSSTRISSSSIRQALTEGRVEDAAQALGRAYEVAGVVVHGDHRGRTLGFPTANLAGIETLVPADGVYAGWLVRASGERLPAAISIGTNPTFDGTDRRVEAHVIDRDDLDLYGERVSVTFTHRLRGTERFGSAGELLVQMRRDVDAARGHAAGCGDGHHGRR